MAKELNYSHDEIQKLIGAIYYQFDIKTVVEAEKFMVKQIIKGVKKVSETKGRYIANGQDQITLHNLKNKPLILKMW